jgi:hypothetical protein
VIRRSKREQFHHGTVKTLESVFMVRVAWAVTPLAPSATMRITTGMLAIGKSSCAADREHSPVFVNIQLFW